MQLWGNAACPIRIVSPSEANGAPWGTDGLTKYDRNCGRREALSPNPYGNQIRRALQLCLPLLCGRQPTPTVHSTHNPNPAAQTLYSPHPLPMLTWANSANRPRLQPRLCYLQPKPRRIARNQIPILNHRCPREKHLLFQRDSRRRHALGPLSPLDRGHSK